MGLFDVIAGWFGVSTGEPAEVPVDPPVPFSDGAVALGVTAEEAFETLCCTALCLHVEHLDAQADGGTSTTREAERALAVVTTTLTRHPSRLASWAVARQQGMLDPPDDDLWLLWEQQSLALGWALTLDPPVVGSLLDELDPVRRQGWDAGLGIVERTSLIDEIEARVLGWARESIAATAPRLRPAGQVEAAIAELDTALVALEQRVCPGRDAWTRMARVAARRDALSWLLAGGGPLDVQPTAPWRDRMARARAATGRMEAADWARFLLASVRGALPDGLEVEPTPRQVHAAARGDAGLLQEDEAGAPVLAWALSLTESDDAPIASWLPTSRVDVDRLVARAELRDDEVLRARRDALRRARPEGARILRLVCAREPASRSEDPVWVEDEEHGTRHPIDVARSRYRVAPRPSGEPTGVPAAPPPAPHADPLAGEPALDASTGLDGVDALFQRGDRIVVDPTLSVPLRPLLHRAHAISPFPWVRALRDAGDVVLQIDGRTVRVWRVEAERITKIADSIEDLLALAQGGRAPHPASVRRGQNWVRAVFAGPGPIVLDLTSGEGARLAGNLGHEDTELDGTTLILPT